MSDLAETVQTFGRELRDADAALAEVGIYPSDPLRPLADRIRELAARVPAQPTGLYEIDLRVTLRADGQEDAEHLARLYQDRVGSLGANQTRVLGVKPEGQYQLEAGRSCV